jgi:hypothetical protein
MHVHEPNLSFGGLVISGLSINLLLLNDLLDFWKYCEFQYVLQFSPK